MRTIVLIVLVVLVVKWLRWRRHTRMYRASYSTARATETLDPNAVRWMRRPRGFHRRGV